jgi:hypothetical protein
VIVITIANLTICTRGETHNMANKTVGYLNSFNYNYINLNYLSKQSNLLEEHITYLSSTLQLFIAFEYHRVSPEFEPIVGTQFFFQCKSCCCDSFCLATH